MTNMEIIELIYQKILTLGLDPYIFTLVLASGYFQKQYLKGVKFIDKMNGDHKTLFVSGIFSAIYVFILYTTSHPNLSEKILGFFVTFVSATSFYRILVKPFNKYITSKFGSNEPVKSE